MLVRRFRLLLRLVSLALALCLTVEVGAVPALAAPPAAPQAAKEADSFVADVMRREFARIGAKTEAFLKELEALGESGVDPELRKLLEDPSVTALSADVTEEFARFLEKEYPDVWRKFFQKAPDMLGIEVDVVIQVLKSDDLKDAEGLRDKLRQAALFFRGDAARMRALFLDGEFRSLVKLSGEPVLHDLAKNSAVGAFVGCGLETGLNLLLGKPIDLKEMAGKIGLDIVRSFLADVTKRTVTKALLSKLATQNKVLYTAVGRFGMVSGTFVSAIVGMVGGELLDWILKGDASGLRKLADHPEVLLERGAMCVAGQLLGEAFSWAFAAVGSVFGPIGTAVGKALGFVVGYAVGYCVVGKILEARRNRDARNFVSKGRYFKARAARAEGVSKRLFDTFGFHALGRIEDLADGDYKKLVAALGGHPPDAEVTTVRSAPASHAGSDTAVPRALGGDAQGTDRSSPASHAGSDTAVPRALGGDAQGTDRSGETEEARELKGKLAEAARSLDLTASEFGLLVKQQLEIDETASFLRAYESEYEEKLDRDLKRMDDETWAKAADAGIALDGALDRMKGTIWYEKIKAAMERTDLVDPELNLWSYDRRSERLVKLGPAFVGDAKETVFVTGKPTDKGAFDRMIDSWVGGIPGEEREPRLRDFLSKYYVKIDDDHFPWHYNPLVDDWAPKYALPTAAAGGVLGLDPDATVGEYGGVTEEGLALLAEVKRIDDAARAGKIDPYADAEAMAETLLRADPKTARLPADLERLRDEMMRASLWDGFGGRVAFLASLGDRRAFDRLAENLTRIRSMNAFLFGLLYDLVRPDERTLAILPGPFGMSLDVATPEEMARILAGNLERLAAFGDLVRTLGAGEFSSVKELLAALDETPSAGFFKRGLDRALQREFERLASPGIFGRLCETIDRITATVGGNAGGRPVTARDVKPEKLGRYLMMANLREAVYGAPYAPAAGTAKEKALLPDFLAALGRAEAALGLGDAPADRATGVNEVDSRLKTIKVK